LFVTQHHPKCLRNLCKRISSVNHRPASDVYCLISNYSFGRASVSGLILTENICADNFSLLLLLLLYFYFLRVLGPFSAHHLPHHPLTNVKGISFISPSCKCKHPPSTPVCSLVHTRKHFWDCCRRRLLDPLTILHVAIIHPWTGFRGARRKMNVFRYNFISDLFFAHIILTMI